MIGKQVGADRKPRFITTALGGRVFIGLSVVVASLLGTVQAQTPNASAVLEAALAAHGGPEAVSRTDRTISQGTWETIRAGVVTRVSDLTVHAGLQGRLRVELSGPGFQRTYVNNGEFGFVVDNGSKRPLSRREMANRLFELNPLPGILRAYRDGRLEARFARIEEDGGVGRVSIRVSFLDVADVGPLRRKLDRSYQVQIDQTSSLVHSLTVFEPSHSSRRPEEPLFTYEYGDYRDAGGLLVPFQVKIFDRAGRPEAQVQFNAFETTDTDPDVREP